ncbi:MAG: serine hydrolase [Blastocatellia bacterium]
MSKHRVLSLALLLLVISFPTVARAQAQARRFERLRPRLEEMVTAFSGTMGIAVRDISTGDELSINGDRAFPMASVYKVPIMVEVFRQIDAGKFSLTDRVQLTDEERTLGSGVLTLMSSGLNPTIEDLITLMIILSDNEATDILLKKVGAANVTATMRSLGLKDIRVDRTTFELIRDYVALYDDRVRGKSYKEITALALKRDLPERIARADIEFAKVTKDVSSPREMALLFEKIVKGQAASPASCQKMMTILRRQQFNQRLPRYLPERVDSAGMAHKTGTIGSTTNDAGVMFVRGTPVALVVFTVDKRIARGEVEEQMGRVARVVFDFFDYEKK